MVADHAFTTGKIAQGRIVSAALRLICGLSAGREIR